MRYTKDEYEAAKSARLVDVLSFMGYELVREGNFYRGKHHDSLVFNDKNNNYHWNSRGLHSKYPIELLKQILIDDYGYDDKTAYLTSIKRLAGTEGKDLFNEPTKYKPPPKPTKPMENATEKADNKALELPPKNKDCKRVFAYLCKTRGLDFEIVRDLVKNNLIYETFKYHNACFVTYGNDHNPKHAFLRGTTSQHFYGDIDGSDKTYGFTMLGKKDSNRLYCFESAIDLISHASLFKMNHADYEKDSRISLNGISFLAIDEFLKNNPQVSEIVSCLDNDKTGEKYTQKMYETYSEKGYKILRHRPHEKDFNEQLICELDKQNNLIESEDFAYESD